MPDAEIDVVIALDMVETRSSHWSRYRYIETVALESRSAIQAKLSQI